MVPCRGPTESLVTCSVSGVGAVAETPLDYITAVPGFRFAVPGMFLNLKKQKLPLNQWCQGLLWAVHLAILREMVGLETSSFHEGVL